MTLLEHFDELCEQLLGIADPGQRESRIGRFVIEQWHRNQEEIRRHLPEHRVSMTVALTDEEIDQMRRDAEESGHADRFRRGFNDEISDELRSRAGLERLLNIKPPWENP